MTKEFPTFTFFNLRMENVTCEMEVLGCLQLETPYCENYKRMLVRTSHQDLFYSTWRQTKQQLSSLSDIEMVSIKGVAMAITLITVCVLATHTSAGIFSHVLIWHTCVIYPRPPSLKPNPSSVILQCILAVVRATWNPGFLSESLRDTQSRL